MLDVDLVHDAGAWRHHLEIIERGLTPPQELIALPVPAILDLDIARERVRRPEHISDHRMINHQLRRRQRIDPGRVAAHVSHRLAHRGQIHHTRHPGEVLHNHPRRRELDLLTRIRIGVPARQRPNVVGGDVRAILSPQQILQRIFKLYGAVGSLDGISRKISYAASPTDRVDLAPKLLTLMSTPRSLIVERILWSRSHAWPNSHPSAPLLVGAGQGICGGPLTISCPGGRSGSSGRPRVYARRPRRCGEKIKPFVNQRVRIFADR